MLDDFFPRSTRGLSIDNCSFRFASFSIRALVSGTWPNNADISKEERGSWNENYVHRDSWARNALQFHERRASKIHLAV